MKIPKAPMPFGYWWAMYTDKVKGDAGEVHYAILDNYIRPD